MSEMRPRLHLFSLMLVALALAAGPVLAAPAEPVGHKPIAQNATRNGKIADLVGKILAQIHYKQHPYDDSISQMQLKMFMEGLDYNHLFFLQSDVDEFTAKYGRRLDDLTAEQDTAAACRSRRR